MTIMTPAVQPKRPSKKNTGIAAVAKRARVSMATVSRTFNQPPLVPEPTRKRVLEAARTLGYPASLRPKKINKPSASLRLGLLIPPLPGLPGNSINEALLHGIHREVLRQRASFHIEHLEDAELGQERELRRRLDRCDGWIMRAPTEESLAATLCRNRPSILLGNTFPGLDVPAVLSDDVAGMQSLLHHLREQGHTRLMFLGSHPGKFLVQRRLATFQSFLIEHNLSSPHHSALMAAEPTVDFKALETFAQNAVQTVLAAKVPPTALVCDSDALAAHVMRELHLAGRSIPRDMSITGFGDSNYAPLLAPPLTSVQIPRRALGEMAAQLLFQLLDGGNLSGHFNIPTQLVVRESTKTSE